MAKIQTELRYSYPYPCPRIHTPAVRFLERRGWSSLGHRIMYYWSGFIRQLLLIWSFREINILLLLYISLLSSSLLQHLMCVICCVYIHVCNSLPWSVHIYIYIYIYTYGKTHKWNSLPFVCPVPTLPREAANVAKYIYIYIYIYIHTHYNSITC